MKNIQSLIKAFIIFLFVSTIFSSCSEDEDGPSKKSHKLVFKIETSSGSSANLCVYGYDATLTTKSGINAQTWVSPEIIAPSSASIATITVNGIGANSSSTIKVQIFVDGVLKKEGTGSGQALTAAAQYNL